jgi:AI-2 transport protein TqsA
MRFSWVKEAIKQTMTQNQAASHELRTLTISVLILTVIATGFALYFLRPVLVPFMLALFFTLCLQPLIDFQVAHLRMPPKLAILGTGLFGLVVLFVVGALVANAVSSMAADYGVYQQQLNALVERLSSAFPAERLGLRPDPETGRIFRLTEATIGGFVSAVLLEISSLISSGVLVAVFAVFILLGRATSSPRNTGLLDEIEDRVKQYISRAVLLASLSGLLVAITLAVLGVRFPVVFGLFVFFLHFIPTLGPVVAVLLPLPLVLLSPDLTPTAKVLALVLPATIQFVLAQVVEPKVMGRTLELHPVTVLLALLFFQMIWGISGALLATPLAAVLKIVLQYFASTKILARGMAGQFHQPGVGLSQSDCGDATQ